MKKIDLLNGPIVPSLAKLAFPIMATSMIQVAYNMVDMFWIGQLSENAVAAVGTAGMYLWLAQGLSAIPKLGAQVRSAHAIGAGDHQKAARYARAAFHMGLILVILFTSICLLFYPSLIGFFQLNHPQVVADAHQYLIIIALGFIFQFASQIFTGIFTSIGNSTAVFQATCTGLITNILLDPLLIFGFAGIPAMGVAGAALATITAQAIVCIVFCFLAKNDTQIFPFLALFQKSNWSEWLAILQIGLPIAMQSIFFSFLSMIMARITAHWGDAAIAAQKVGTQIESISYMTADGFATAVNAFIAQNYGSGKVQRIKKGYWTSIRLILLWSIFTSFLLIVYPVPIFHIFLREPHVVGIGTSYLTIMGYSQIMMCLEITSSGAFQGLGKPLPAMLVGIIGNIIRIPLALGLSSTALGLDGIWWSITISSILKGFVVFFWFIITLRRFLKEKERSIKT